MPICKNCQSSFPNKIFLDGKIRILTKRKYCLACSSWNKPSAPGEVVCATCKRKFVYDRSKGHNKTRCNSCVVNARRSTFKAKCIKYKGGKCEVCGYSKCNRALSFHHINPENKKFAIGGAHSRRWNEVIKELDKCLLLCANCHMELHDEPEHV